MDFGRGLLFGAVVSHASAQAVSSPTPVAAAAGETLTRGPIHEAFAQTVVFSPQPGITVDVRPPEPIEEIPPEVRPDGERVVWISGYWAWDDERNDFIWVSGVWRKLPPGRQWVPGYWSDTGAGTWQWVCGYWADAAVREVRYLRAPPATLEVGANIPAPSSRHIWDPGCWQWQEDEYQWRPGYWIEGRADCAWIPSYYCWTPRGYIYVDGYWDYSADDRGVCFAPVYYRDRSPCYTADFVYSPSIVVSFWDFSACLFVRPRYHHYYCGDYFAPAYIDSGYYPWHRFHSGRHGYDPLYVSSRWKHRDDDHWDRKRRDDYEFLVRNESGRPPRSWNAYREWKGRGGEERYALANTVSDFARRPKNASRFKSLSKEERRALAGPGRSLKEFRNERRALERASAADGSGRRDFGKAKQSRSPVSSDVSENSRNDRGPRGRADKRSSDSSDASTLAARSDTPGTAERANRVDRPNKPERASIDDRQGDTPGQRSGPTAWIVRTSRSVPRSTIARETHPVQRSGPTAWIVQTSRSVPRSTIARATHPAQRSGPTAWIVQTSRSVPRSTIAREGRRRPQAAARKQGEKFFQCRAPEQSEESIQRRRPEQSERINPVATGREVSPARNRASNRKGIPEVIRAAASVRRRARRSNRLHSVLRASKPAALVVRSRPNRPERPADPGLRALEQKRLPRRAVETENRVRHRAMPEMARARRSKSPRTAVTCAGWLSTGLLPPAKPPHSRCFRSIAGLRSVAVPAMSP